MGEFPSGQRGQTVNLLRFASMVRIRPPPPRKSNTARCWIFLYFELDSKGGSWRQPGESILPHQNNWMRKCSVVVFWSCLPLFRSQYSQAAGNRKTQKFFHLPLDISEIHAIISKFVEHNWTFGGVPEWPKGTDCKSAAFRFDGSNPSSPTKNRRSSTEGWRFFLLYYFLFTLHEIHPATFGK